MPEMVFIKFTDYSQFFFLLSIFLRRVKACGLNFILFVNTSPLCNSVQNAETQAKKTHKNLLQKIQDNKFLLLKSAFMFSTLKRKEINKQKNPTTTKQNYSKLTK